MKSELSPTAGGNLAAKVMYESTCALVHLSSIVIKKYIVAPETKEEIEDCMAEFTEAGKLFD